MPDLLKYIPLDRIEPDKNQPRRFGRVESSGMTGDVFFGASDGAAPVIDGQIADDLETERESATSLVDAILAHGVIQPIRVRPIKDRKAGERFRIVAGERRWRASQIAKQRIETGTADTSLVRKDYDFSVIPAIVEETSDDDRLEAQLVENIQRLDMSARDIGRALMRLQNDSSKKGLSIRAIARRLGKNTSWVQDMLAAGSGEGQDLMARLNLSVEDWHHVRHVRAQEKKRPRLYWEALRRAGQGEVMDRHAFAALVLKYEQEEEQREGDEALRRRSERIAAAEAERMEEEAEQERKALEDFRGVENAVDDSITPEQMAEAQAEDDEGLPTPEQTVAFNRHRSEREQFRRRQPNETVTSWLHRLRSADYAAQVEDGDLDDPLLVEQPDMSPPLLTDPLVKIELEMPRSRAEQLAGLLDDLIQGKPSPAPHPVEGEPSRKIAARIVKLLEAMERRQGR